MAKNLSRVLRIKSGNKVPGTLFRSLEILVSQVKMKLLNELNLFIKSLEDYNSEYRRISPNKSKRIRRSQRETGDSFSETLSKNRDLVDITRIKMMIANVSLVYTHVLK